MMVRVKWLSGLGREPAQPMFPSTDDDFQAFRVLAKSSISVDIQVTVGRSQGAPPPVALVSQPTLSLWRL